MKVRLLSILVFVLVFEPISHASESQGTDNSSSPSTYGGIGIIQTPTARMSDDGVLAFGISSESPFNRLYSRMQFFPWMEIVLRYTEGKHKPYYPGNPQTWKDKGLDIKFNLLDEGKIIPEISLGLVDLGGTGAFSSEYLVASKKYKDLDFTIGMGFGGLAGSNNFKNPVGIIFDSYNQRGGGTKLGGTVSLGNFFSGPKASLFGGIEYKTSLDNLTLKLEYDSSDYSENEGRKKNFFREFDEIFKVDSRINAALNYKIKMSERDMVDLSLGYVRGNTIFANISVHSNLNFKGTDKARIGPEKIRNTNLGVNSFHQLDNNRQNFLINRIIKEMANNGFVTHNIIFSGDELAAEVSQGRFLETSKYIDLAARILANNSLPNIKTVTVINIDLGIETFRASVNRSDLVNAVSRGPLPEILVQFDRNQNFDKNVLVRENEYLYPHFYWQAKPKLSGTLQHQIQFYFWQLEADIHTEYSIRKGLYFTTDIGISVANNFDDYIWHYPDGELYHVRQDRRLYLTEGKSGIRRMALDNIFSINRNIKAKFSIGYLEWMFGGAGGEILYIPDTRNWGIGAELFWVKQRDFDQKFSFRDYDTVTGFLNFYYDLPFYDLRFKASAGRFLAEDKGFELDISRRFESGARIGAKTALTDCDAQCVGEGSFNKWIYFELPMDLFYINRTTRDVAGYEWSPLTKDAGQKVAKGGSLYELATNATDEIDYFRNEPWSIKKIFSGFGLESKNKNN
tara:strand:+ start:219 stop:2435 length:2217 start_codon:yes stop_codon:yes gene_type:complete